MLESVLVFLLLALLIRHVMWSFPAQKPVDYNDTPAFDPRTHLNGPLTCDGVIFGPAGRVVSRFTARMEGEWNGDQGVLREWFQYDSGTEQTRVWHLRLAADGRLQAEAEDVIGAGSGHVTGSAMGLRYRIRLAPGAGGHVLSVVDWMYLVPGGALVNRSQFRKFGLKVAELVATIRPAT
ncbi:MAG TPA: DUF3833 domain-containing protein [Gemmobacter sp.]|nr:DUF3833 domain-containing protein [Gemmobacter sp.]